MNTDPRFVADMAAYLKSNGYSVPGKPVGAEVEGTSEWSGGCETCAYTINSIEVTLYYERGDGSTDYYGNPRRSSFTVEDFNMAGFMSFVYERMGVAA